MRVFLTGGTGLIGRVLVRRLLDRGDQPVVLSRKADKARINPALKGAKIVQGDPTAHGLWDGSVDGCDAVVNLAGHNLFADRWDAEVKRKIRDSRVYGTDNLVGAISRASQKPKVLVQGSAIGYYGSHGDEELDESSPSGTDFLAVTCREWEQAADPVESMGLRLAKVRTGVVLAKGEAALGVMTPIFKLGGASAVGNGGSTFKPARGQQWMSWIHLDDIAGIFLEALDNEGASGPINGVTPNPVRNIDFGRALAKVLRRPFLPFGPPDFVLKMVLGQVAEIVVEGQRVLPKKAESLGYRFRHPELLPALRQIFGKADSTADRPGSRSATAPASSTG